MMRRSLLPPLLALALLAPAPLALAAQPGPEAGGKKEEQGELVRPPAGAAADEGGRFGAAAVASRSNPAAIAVPGTGTIGPASPYPSAIQVAGVAGAVVDIDVTLRNFGHVFPEDVDVMLVGPGGQAAVLLSDAGGGTDANNATLTFDDEAAAALTGDVASGRFRPTNFGAGDPFPAPAPASGGSALSAFDGTNPNGAWRLYAVDDFSFDTGTIASGWSLEIRTDGAPAAKNDTYRATAGKTLRRGAPGVLANDRAGGDGALTVAKVKNPRKGRLSLKANGSFTYTPDRDASGKDRFTYRVTGPDGLTDTATVTIRIKPQD